VVLAMDKIDKIFYPSDLDQSNLEIAVTAATYPNTYKNVTMVTKGTLKFKNFKVLN
jgi:hypothetical protein